MLSAKTIPARERLIHALDLPDVEEAKRHVTRLGDAVNFYKVGLEIFMTGRGYELIDWLNERGKKIFVDLKFFDVPNTVGSAVRQLKGRHATFATVHGNDRAALEACVGGALFPGIEAGWMLRDIYAFSEPFRLDHTFLSAGDVTKQMAVPWQTDFYDCALDGSLAWWPATRPDDVFPEKKEKQVPWIRGLVGSGRDMIARWHKLGFVIKEGGIYIERRN